MTAETLCEKIGMPQTVTEEALCADIGMAPQVAERLQREFMGAQTYAAAYTKAESLLSGTDPRGMKMLALLLRAAAQAKDAYDAAGIDERVYYDTMRCFPRFVGEYKAAYGVYGFDRGWWVGRQLSGMLFRLGALEYELTEYRGEKALSVHIPSDADLSEMSVAQSLRAARIFTAAHFPAYAHARFFCESWLLSPALRELLPPSSRILRFAALFDVAETNEDDTGYVRWVYKVPDVRPEKFCEHTSLQRSIKKYVLSGGKIGDATGVLKEEEVFTGHSGA